MIGLRVQHAYVKISEIILAERNVKLQSSKVLANMPIPALPASFNEAVRNDRVICV